MIAVMRDDPSVVALVEQARTGDKAAWDRIVERYAPLVWSICVRHRLSDADAEDVGANVWLRLVERLETLREPAALPGWLVTTTRNECLVLLRGKQKQVPVEHDRLPEEVAVADLDEAMVAAERHLLLRTAFAELSEKCRRLLSMLFDDPPTPYAEIGERLGMPIGGIGPNRMRCLQQLRRRPAVAAMVRTGVNR
jgi:RNA polymerase sigma factor (sigma-70 family)